MTFNPSTPPPYGSTPPPLPPAGAFDRLNTLGQPAREFEATELAGKQPKWRVLLYDDRIRLLPPDGSLPHDVHRPEVEHRLELADVLLFPRTMTVKLPKRVTMRIARPDFEAVESWVGMGRLMRQTLKQRLGCLLPLAMFLVIPSLVFPLMNRDGGFIPFDKWGLALGCGFLLLWSMWRMRPSAGLFLFDAVLFFLLAALVGWRLRSSWSWLAFGFMLLQLTFAVSGVRMFRRFRGIKPDPTPA